MRNNIVVVIPCYNAADCIVQTIEGVLKCIPESKIIIVDDNSPDKSFLLIKKRFNKNSRVQLILRKNKEGRGSAVLRGFQEGLKDKHALFFVEMDADLCHDPKYIPFLIKKCQKYDIAIASKYLKTSQIIGLSKKRMMFSRIANYYIKLMLKIPITDCTNGFRCYTRKTLEKINFDSFSSKGFIVLSEIAYKIYRNGSSFGEIPFIFTFNRNSKSSFNFTEIKEGLLTILRLKFSDNFKLR